MHYNQADYLQDLHALIEEQEGESGEKSEKAQTTRATSANIGGESKKKDRQHAKHVDWTPSTNTQECTSMESKTGGEDGGPAAKNAGGHAKKS